MRLLNFLIFSWFASLGPCSEPFLDNAKEDFEPESCCKLKNRVLIFFVDRFWVSHAAPCNCLGCSVCAGAIHFQFLSSIKEVAFSE